MIKKIRTPITSEVIASLRTGDEVEISGVIYTARDAAHRRLDEAFRAGRPLPIDVRGQVIYYVGPTPPRPGQAIGSAGPTTSIRMDVYVEPLLAAGLKGMIGKGGRSAQVREALKRYQAVYLGAVGGAAVLLTQHVVKAEVVAYEDLGTEAIRRLEVRSFPVVVVNDMYGDDLLEQARREWGARLTGNGSHR
jgi:fumarate hydratase subunit beta